MSNLWEKVKFIYGIDANQSDGYVECDIDKNYTLIWTSTRYTKPTDKQLNDIKDSDIESGTKLNALRHQRDLLLQQSDWIVIREREEGGSVSNFTDWKKYRQELRDITKTYKSLDDVKWIQRSPHHEYN